MAKNRVLALALAAIMTGSPLLSGWAEEAKSPATIPNLGAEAVVPAELPPALSPEAALAVPSSIVGAQAPAEAAAVPAAPQAAVSAQAELAVSAAQIYQAAGRGGAGAESQASKKVFDAAGSGGDSQDSDDSQQAMLRGAGDASDPAGKLLPETAFFTVIPEVVYPGTTRVFSVTKGREDYIRQLNHASDGLVVCLTERDSTEEGTDRGHFPVGTLAKMKVLEDGEGMHVAYEGVAEVNVERYINEHSVGVYYPRMEDQDKAKESFYMRQITRIVTKLTNEEEGLKLSERFDKDRATTTNQMLAQFSPGLVDQQDLLASMSVAKRLDFVRRAYVDFMKEQTGETLPADNPEEEAVSQKIEHVTREDVSKEMRKAYLQRMQKSIAKELGEGDEADPALKKVEERYAKIKDKMPAEAREAVEKELRHAKRSQPAAQGYDIVIGYLEWLTDLPWGEYTKDNDDIQNAAKILDDDHYGIKDVKERIIEFMAVRKAVAALNAGSADGQKKGKILAFDGPPGTGKTSVGKSIAKALGRKFIRISLSGMHDEAELRGHRRTYLGALPGRIIQNMKKAGSMNPVILLDEIEKVGSGAGEPGRRGNAENSLVELLDPEQNSAWHDNYLDVDFDLSQVLFIGTSNDLRQLSEPVRDRLEIISFSSYIEEEKREIAKRHLIAKQLAENGFPPGAVSFTDDAINAVIHGYTNEGGVRSLERELGTILRKMQKRKQEGAEIPKVVDVAQVTEYLRSAKIVDSHFDNEVGVASGLYWTPTGGGILPIETVALPKGLKGKRITVTGKLQEVMQESADISFDNAVLWAKAHGVKEGVFTSYEFALHVPDGAVPKDGPSAGITMTTALASLFTGRAVKQGYAMTGEITLKGRVTPIGGLKEKALGALRLGYTDIIISRANVKSLEELPGTVKELDANTYEVAMSGDKKLVFHAVDKIDQVLDIVLEKDGTPMKPVVSRKRKGASAEEK